MWSDWQGHLFVMLSLREDMLNSLSCIVKDYFVSLPEIFSNIHDGKQPCEELLEIALQSNPSVIWGSPL